MPTTDSRTLVDWSQDAARRQPEARLFTYLLDGEAAEVHLTRGELDARARAIAAELSARGLVGRRVLLLYAPGLDFIAAFFGCLYAGVVAVPAYPPDPSRLARTLPRLRAIVADCEPALVLTTTPLLEMAPFVIADAPELATATWAASDAWVRHDGAPAPAPPRLADLAFIQYTSGSTATPKGVMIGHDNLLANLRQLQLARRGGEETTIVSWLPFYHDLGLIGAILLPVFLGGRSVLMSPIDFLKRPVRWLRAIDRFRADTSAAPNFALDLCTRKVAAADLAGLDLSCWKMALIGAEPLQHAALERFSARFAACGLHPHTIFQGYGLAEVVLASVCGSLDVRYRSGPFDAALLREGRVSPAAAEDRSARVVVSCGTPMRDERVEIVDPTTRVRSPGDRIGEIWIAGPNVARGYWNRPADTAATFGAFLSDTGEGPFLRTGDLGFFVDGEVYVTGRIKDLIIVGGKNHHPEDIEQTVEASHPRVRAGGTAAFSIDERDEERLAVAAEIDPRALPEGAGRRAALDEVVDAIRRGVGAGHELPVHSVVLVGPGSLPKTSSGKIMRRECRAELLGGRLAEIDRSVLPAAPAAAPPAALAPPSPAARTEAEIAAWLRSRLAEHLDVAPGAPAVDVPFAELGLRSVEATALAGELEAELGHPVSPAVFYDHADVAALARYLGETIRRGAPIEPVRAAAPAESEAALRGSPGSAAADLLSWIDDYVRARYDPVLVDDRRAIEPHVVLDFGARGLLGLLVPRRWGGLGLSHVDACRVVERLSAIDLSLAVFVATHVDLGTVPLLHHGTDALRDELLPQLAAGRVLGAFALTEPGAGSAPESVQTLARPLGAGVHALHGEKVINASGWAGVVHVLARQLDAEGRARGYSAFTLRQPAKGVHQGGQWLTLGLRGTAKSRLLLEGARVEAHQVLGRVGGGMEVADRSTMHARLGVGVMGLGAIRSAVRLAARYAERRQVAGGRLVDHPVTRRGLHEAILAGRMLEALVFRCAALHATAGGPAPSLPLACKILGAELSFEVADGLVQTLGWRGYAENNPAARLLRDVRALRIAEGPTEALRGYLGGLAAHAKDDLEPIRGATDSASRHRARAAELADRIGKLASLGPRDRNLFLRDRLGELTSWSVARAVAEPTGDAALLAWIDARSDAVVRGVGAEEHWLSGDALLAEAERLTADLRDGGVHDAGWSRGVDPLLVAEAPPAPAAEPPRLRSAEERAEPAGARGVPSSSGPITALQRAMFDVHRELPDSGIIAAMLEVQGDVDSERVRGGLRAVMARHPLLRCAFAETGTEVRRLPRPRAEPPLAVVDDRRAGPAEALERARRRVNAPLSLTEGLPWRAVLTREADDRWIMGIGVHHAVSDAASLNLIVQALIDGGALGASAAPGGVAEPPPGGDAEDAFEAFVAEEHRLLADEGERRLSYWRGRLAEARWPALPADRTPGAREPHTMRYARRPLPEPLVAGVHEAVARLGVHVEDALLWATAVTLSRLGDAPTVALATIHSLRDRRLGSVVGPCYDYLPVVYDGAAHPPPGEAIKTLVKRRRADLAQRLPYAHLAARLEGPWSRGGPLCGALFNALDLRRLPTLGDLPGGNAVRPLDPFAMNDGLIVPFERPEVTFLPILRRGAIELVVAYREARDGAARLAVVLDGLGEALAELVGAT